MNFIKFESRKNWRPGSAIKLLVISLLLKIAYLFFAFIILDDPSVFSFDGYCKMIQRNDSGWYEKIAINWYPEITEKKDLGYNNGREFKQSEWAFFPLYPAMNRVFICWPGIDFDMTGLIYSLLFSCLAFIGFYWFCMNYTGNPDKSFYLSLLLILFPFHYYFSMMCTEAVYFTLLIFSFISISERKYLLIPFLIIPLVLVRPNGIIGLIPLYLYFLERNDIISKKSFRVKSLLSRKILLTSLLFLTGILAFILYGFYQKHMTGNFFAFSAAQAGWYRRFMFPFMSFFRRGDFTTQFNSVYTLTFILLAAISWKKFPLSLNILIWTGLLIPLFSGSVTSMPRFISVIFPFTILIGDWLYSFRYKYYVLGLLFFLQLFVFYFWLTGHPFSC
jgi:hypothetical protein